MKFKRLIFILSLFAGSVCLAQTTEQEYYDKYLRLTSRLGYAGVGMETYLQGWEKAFPQDARMQEAKCNFFLARSVRTEAVPKEAAKYLGNGPVLTLKDSLGRDINFFEEQFFDDELFGQAVASIDRAIALEPEDLSYRADKVSMLLAYEKESPDMALQELNSLVDIQKREHPKWEVSGTEIEESDFIALMSGYCYDLYKIGTAAGYEAFGSLSNALSRLYPKESNFIDNIGSYYLVYKGDERKAMKYYKKALKLNPEDNVAKSNISLIERRKSTKTKKK